MEQITLTRGAALTVVPRYVVGMTLQSPGDPHKILGAVNAPAAMAPGISLRLILASLNSTSAIG